MKIRPSLRLYFFASVVLLSTVMTLGYSILSVSYFIDGLDRGINGTMFQLSQSTKVQANAPKNLLGFTVASTWQDTPSVIQEKFVVAPSKPGELNKRKDQDSIFSLPKNLYFVALYYAPGGEPLYISKVMLEKDRKTTMGTVHPEQRLLYVAITALIAIVLFAFILMMIMQKIAKPIEALKHWAKNLSPKTLHANPPDFKYNELNTLASLVRNSLLSAHDSLMREQRFLSYASHELRTPISVIRSNVDLLKKLHQKYPLHDKQHLTLERIERAGLTMTSLTDTLLWLSRSDEQKAESDPLSDIDIFARVEQLCAELRYLLQGKSVELSVEHLSSTSIIHTKAIGCQIVLSNLIRNAFQHTQHGSVIIKVTQGQVNIVNTSEPSPPSLADKASANVNTGYGLGLELSEKIIQRYNWQYSVKQQNNRYEVNVDFT